MANHISLKLYIVVMINFTISFYSVSTQADSCGPSGTLTCDGKKYKKFDCSPPILSPTFAKLTHNNFDKGGDGGDPSSCFEMYYSNTEPVVALSTGWYNEGSLCGKKILIYAISPQGQGQGRSVEATVVDECDSNNGCDKPHAGLPPCPNNVVDASKAVWDRLGLNINDGIVDISWQRFF